MVFELDGRTCTFSTRGRSGPCVFVGTFPGRTNDLFLTVSQMCAGVDFSLFTFELTEWESECAPWDASPNGREIIGGSTKMLEWLRDRAIPEFAEDRERLIAGYSMSGLLAMWTMYNTDLFHGAACCSGSLWYPMWDTYVQSHRILSPNACIYLSLGGKEARTAPPYMASIGTNMRIQAERMRSDPNVRTTIFEMNPGGHFTKTDERLAKGIAWLLRETGK